tara:strand:- start:19726 stop:20004 length:279 start_codon:yes stop_codon:yes gene_type:complete
VTAEQTRWLLGITSKGHHKGYQTMDIDKAVDLAVAWLDEIEGVEGVAQGESNGKACITVFVSLKETGKKLPASFHGFKVVIDESGLFSAETP